MPRLQRPLGGRSGTPAQPSGSPLGLGQVADTVERVQEPILTFEGLDLIVCATVSEAEGHVEAYDVAVVDAYDAAGQVLRFEVDGWKTSLRATGDHQPERLRAALEATFRAVGVSVPADASLDNLVSEASQRFSVDQSLTFLGRLGRRLFDRSR